MATILAGRFDSTVQVLAVLRELGTARFGRQEYASYYVNPPGRYGLYRLAEQADSRDKGIPGGPGRGGSDKAAGVMLSGLAATAGAREVDAPAPAGIGVTAAYLNVLSSLDRSKATREGYPEAGAGPMVAICVDRPGTEQIARATLHRHGAHTIERLDGRWEDGDWKDFDPYAASPAFEGQT